MPLQATNRSALRVWPTQVCMVVSNEWIRMPIPAAMLTATTNPATVSLWRPVGRRNWPSATRQVGERVPRRCNNRAVSGSRLLTTTLVPTSQRMALA